MHVEQAFGILVARMGDILASVMLISESEKESIQEGRSDLERSNLRACFVRSMGMQGYTRPFQ